MTDNEIIKALECCVNKKCSECPIYCNDEYLGTTVMREALDLLNRQKAEIERLSNERVVHRKIIDDRAEAILQHDAVIRDLHKQLKDAKSEAIKEFAERVKLKFYEEFDELIPSIMADEIDNLVGEMAGENNENL